MAKLNKTLSSIVLLVAFLAVTAIATIMYGGSADDKAKMEQNFFYQKTNLVLSYAWVAAKSLIGLNLNKNVGINQSAQDDLAVTSNDLQDVQPDFLSRTAAKIQAEWEKGDSENLDSGANIGELIKYQETENGGELILKPKSGVEYKIPLSFKSGNK
jgi:hypothetical protein